MFHLDRSGAEITDVTTPMPPELPPEPWPPPDEGTPPTPPAIPEPWPPPELDPPVPPSPDDP